MSNIDNIQRKIRKIYASEGLPSGKTPIQLQSIEWSYRAIDYLVAASVLEKKGLYFSHPKLQITGHSIECALKACISSVGNKPQNTHDLVRLYREVEKLGYQLDSKYQAMIVHLNHLYFQDLGTGTKFKLRYPTDSLEGIGGAIPSHDDMASICKSLLKQAADKAPDILKEMFGTIPIYTENLEHRA